MTPIKVVLPHVHASGQREGWWFHVTGIAEGKRHKFAGFADFAGERLSAGECELPPMAVVLLVRPVGSIRMNARSADLMYVSPSSGELVGQAYGFQWEAGAAYEKLRLAVHGALLSQAKFVETDNKLKEMLTGWIGQGINEGLRERLSKEIAGIVKAAIPNAVGVEVVPSEQASDKMTVTFSLPGKDCTRIVRCAVPGYNGMGDPDFAFLCVRVPLNYEFVEEDFEKPDKRHHAYVARVAAARDLGYDVADDAPVFDDGDDRFEALLGMFHWDSAYLLDLDSAGVSEPEGGVK